jgi:Ca2+/H+ antiporter
MRSGASAEFERRRLPFAAPESARMKSRNLALRAAMPHWSVLGPPAALLVLVFGYGSRLSTPMLLAVAAALIAAVLSAVHHAEVVAHRVGEPFGTLVLAVAVTVIEVALVVSMMLSGGIDAATLARDTVFAAVMIVCNGVVGLCLLVGGLRHHVVAFRVDGTGSALAVLAALSTLTLVLPAFTTTTDGPTAARRHESSSSREATVRTALRAIRSTAFKCTGGTWRRSSALRSRSPRRRTSESSSERSPATLRTSRC